MTELTPAILAELRRLEAEATPAPWEEVPQSRGGPIIARRYETGYQMNPTGLRLICHIFQREIGRAHV